MKQNYGPPCICGKNDGSRWAHLGSSWFIGMHSWCKCLACERFAQHFENIGEGVFLYPFDGDRMDEATKHWFYCLHADLGRDHRDAAGRSIWRRIAFPDSLVAFEWTGDTWRQIVTTITTKVPRLELPPFSVPMEDPKRPGTLSRTWEIFLGFDMPLFDFSRGSCGPVIFQR